MLCRLNTLLYKPVAIIRCESLLMEYFCDAIASASDISHITTFILLMGSTSLGISSRDEQAVSNSINKKKISFLILILLGIYRHSPDQFAAK